VWEFYTITLLPHDKIKDPSWDAMARVTPVAKALHGTKKLKNANSWQA